MRKREQETTARLKKHLQHSGIHIGSCAIEVKVTTGKSIPFDAVQPHQLQALKNATGTLAWKIADDSAGAKPFDLFVLQNAGAYVALAFLVPRTELVVYLIPLRGWLALQESCGRKSVTEKMIVDAPALRVMKLVLPSMSQSHAQA